MEHLWSPFENIRLERWLWCIVMEEQRKLGLDIPTLAITRSQEQADQVDQVTLDRIDARERITRHDLKARLEIFCEDAGHEYHHLGMTSADVVDNVTQIRVMRSLRYLRSVWELELDQLIERYPMRGIKGPMGTQADQMDLLGDYASSLQLDIAVADRFGFTDVCGSIGQVYPRSLDFEVASIVQGELRNALYAGTGGQEVRGLLAIICGYVAMLTNLSQWNEGDVSTSVVRRVALPGLFLTAEQALIAAFDTPEP
jgi:adenylosuccinate lyase